MERDKKIALVAHDNKKGDLVAWAKYNRVLLAHHQIYATGTTGTILERELGFFVCHLCVLAGTACHVVAVLRYAA
jgi:methylglyoxal synthase